MSSKHAAQNARALKAFGEQLRAVGDKAEVIVRKVAIDLATKIVMASPVGNPSIWKGPAPEGYVGGRFRGNWQIGLNFVNEATDSPPNESGGAVLGRVNAALGNFKIGQKITFTNSMPYARRLEYEGWSSQAPAGMVGIAVGGFYTALRKAQKK